MPLKEMVELRKNIVAVLVMILSMSVFGTVFAASETNSPQKKEIIVIPKIGILESPIDLGDGSLAVYRDNAVLAMADSDTKISPKGNFLMKVHIFPTVPSTKSKEWESYTNNVCASWADDRGRLPVSPTRVGEVVFYVEVNETEAKYRIYGIAMYELRKDGNVTELHLAIENKTTKFHTAFSPLKDEVLFDAAYRKIIQYHRGY